MARGVDLSSLTPAERTVFAGSVLLFANGFVPWWFRTTTSQGTITYNAGLTGASLIAVLAAALAAIAIVVRAMIWPEPAPRRDALLYVSFGLVAVVALAVSIATRTGVWLGTYAAILFALIVLLGAARRARERRTGWS